MKPVKKTFTCNNFLHIFIGTGITLLTLTMMNKAQACAACGGTLSKDWATQGINKPLGFSNDLSYNYIAQNQQRYGTNSASAAQIKALNTASSPQEIEDFTTTRTTTVSLNYTSDDWGVITQIPFVQRTHGTFGNTGGWPVSSSSSGYAVSDDSSIGDITVIGKYNGFSAEKTSGVITGIKLPTGSTNANFLGGASPLDRSLQIGTGSTDLILGGYTTGTIAQYGWFAQCSLQHAISTKIINNFDFRPGDAYSINAGVHYGEFGAKFTPLLQLNFIHRKPDTPDTGMNAGATPPDALTGGPATGGTLLYISPGASFRVGGGTSIYGFVQLPIYQNVNSLQLTARYILTFGASHSF